MFSFFVGCDMSKEWFDVAYYAENEPIYLGQFDNNHSGYKKALKALRSVTSDELLSWLIAFENTGAYSKDWFVFLFDQNIPCAGLNPLHLSKSKGLSRGKTDKTDARFICNYCYEKRMSLTPMQPDNQSISQLKKLLSYRTLLVKQRKALDSALKDLPKMYNDQFIEGLKQSNLQLLTKYKEKIQQIDEHIELVLKSNETVKKNAELVQSVIGIGPVTTASCIAFTGNFTSFDEARKFACYIGVAPFPNSSGKFIGRNGVSPVAHKRLKSLFTNAAKSAIMHDPQLKAYYERKIAEGKEYGVVINAIKNKLVHRIFSVVKRQTPFVKLYAYA